MNFKHIAGATAVAMLLSSSAFAADAFSYEPSAPEAVTPIFSWTGAYLGLNAGYAGGKAKHHFSGTDFDDSINLNANGFVGGAQIGYNYQIDQVVLGVEADFQGSNAKAEFAATALDEDELMAVRMGTKLNWYGTVRARLGVTATDRFMAYATGGLAYGRTTSYINGDAFDEAIRESVKKTKAGWTIGAGAEYAITDNVTFKTEYLYTDLGKSNLFNGEIDGDTVNINRKFNFHTVRAGINYKF